MTQHQHQPQDIGAEHEDTNTYRVMLRTDDGTFQPTLREAFYLPAYIMQNMADRISAEHGGAETYVEQISPAGAHVDYDRRVAALDAANELAQAHA